MNDVEMFEKRGQVIYGIARINHLLTELDVWFTGHRRSQSEKYFETPDSKFEMRSDAARAHFAAHPMGQNLLGPFIQLLVEFRELERDSNCLGLENPALVSAMLIRIKHVHIAAAEIVERIGYERFSASKLRQCADEIETAVYQDR